MSIVHLQACAVGDNHLRICLLCRSCSIHILPELAHHSLHAARHTVTSCKDDNQTSKCFASAPIM